MATYRALHRGQHHLVYEVKELPGTTFVVHWDKDGYSVLEINGLRNVSMGMPRMGTLRDYYKLTDKLVRRGDLNYGGEVVQ